MEWPERITLNPDVLCGKPVIKGTRISVELILEFLGSGWTEGDILENYPHISVEDIRACLRYAQKMVESERAYPLPEPLQKVG